MESETVKLIGTAIEFALKKAEEHLSKARATRTVNAAACAEYLRAAQTVIAGLEDEVDEILIESKMVAHSTGINVLSCISESRRI
jgi:hypothetical protein